MFKNSMTPRTVTRTVPARPSLVYSLRGSEYARIMASTKAQGVAK